MTLARQAAVAALARAVVVGQQVASGGLGPPEYYQSEREYLEALLRSRLRR